MAVQIKLKELQQRFGGQLIAGVAGGDVTCLSVETDTRNSLTGALFVALCGDRFDGHDFCRQAVSQGAVGVVVSRYCPEISCPQWLVPDTCVALGQIALFNRQYFTGTLIGITGNSGKTTVKEMLGAIFTAYAGAEQVLMTQGNLNNEIGVPLTLLRLTSEHRYAVVELGANHLGEIAYSAGLAQPDIGVVLNVTGAHLGEFGSLDNIAQAKGELISALGEQGVAVINGSDTFAGFWTHLAGSRPILHFCMPPDNAPADILYENSVYAQDITAGDQGYRFLLCLPQHTAVPVELRLPGRHNIANALAAAAAAWSAGVPASAIGNGLSLFAGVARRLQSRQSLSGAYLIDDSYNANPGSVRAAIDLLAERSGIRMLVLGDVGELGESAVQEHRKLGEYARNKGLDHLCTVGTLSAAASEVFGKGAYHFADQDQLIAALQQQLTADYHVLVKGSRRAAMDRVVDALCL